MSVQLLTYLAGATLALGLTAATSVSTLAQSAMEEYSKPLTKFNFGPAFHPPKGKKLTLVSCGAIAEGCAAGAAAAKEAATALGWDARIIDGKLDPAVWNQAVQHAVADRSDGIVNFAITPALIQGGLNDATKANIPVVTVFIPIFDGIPTTAVHISVDHIKGGTAGAEFLTKDMNGRGTVLILDTPQFPELMKRNNALADNLKKLCHGCTVIRQDFNAAQAHQRLAGQVASLVTANPAINYISMPYDAIGSFVSQGLLQAGKSDSVKVFAYEGTSIGIDLMRNRDIRADISTPLRFAGWLSIDAIARKLAGVEQPQSVELPVHLFAPGDSLPEKYWEPELDYRTALKALWQ